jgi:hypothetical protein
MAVGSFSVFGRFPIIFVDFTVDLLELKYD